MSLKIIIEEFLLWNIMGPWIYTKKLRDSFCEDDSAF